MTLGVADVNNIVLANIGGMPQTPATTTLVEGKIVTPQISTLCALGQAIAHLWDAIKAALKSFMDGIDNLIINPLKAFATACLNAINAILAKIAAAINAASALLKAAIQAVLDALNAAIKSITDIIAHIGRLIGEKLQQLLAALTMCAPASVGAKQYGKDDVASSLEQKQPILDIQDQATVIDSIISDTSMTDDAKIAARLSFSLRSDFSACFWAVISRTVAWTNISPPISTLVISTVAGNTVPSRRLCTHSKK